MLKSKNVLFLMSGSISCYKSCDLVSKLVQAGHSLKVGMSKAATEFVGEATLEGLTGEPVFTDEYQSGRVMDHINLLRWADLVVLSPATANTINAMASGLSTSLPSSLFLAHDFSKPFIVFPAMNTKMLEHPSTKASIEKLKSWGIKLAGPDSGGLACGEVGSGRLLETEESLNLLKAYL